MFWDMASPCSQAGHSSSSTPVCASQRWNYICALSATAEFLWLLFAVYHFQVATNPIITSLTLCNWLYLRYTENYDNRKQNNYSTLKKRKIGIWTVKLGQQVNALSTKPGDLSLMPGSHRVDAEKFSQVALWSPRGFHGTHICTQ